MSNLLEWGNGTELYTGGRASETDDHLFVFPLPYHYHILLAMTCNSQKILSSPVFFKCDFRKTEMRNFD
jgi:hypothetical protein